MSDDDPAQPARREQQPAAQLETYAADLSRTYAELRRHLQRMTALHEVTTRMASALDPEVVVDGVLDSLTNLVRYQSAAVYLLDLDVAVPAEGPHSVTPASRLPRLSAARASSPDAAGRAEGSVASEESIVVEAMREQRSVSRALASGGVELGVPLRAGGRALGAIELTLRTLLGADDVKILELLAAAAAVALQNAHLYQETQRLATTDALTGLSNYRHFHELLALEVARSKRMGYPVGVLMMDLDHFKQINDRHGHSLGDQALRRVADQLRSRLRRTDVIARLGGEEFAALLPGDGLQEVAVVAEKLRRAVEELPPVRGGMGTASTLITVSVGGASLTSNSVDADALLAYADRALYEAKRNGRNQVRMWSADLATSISPTITSSTHSATVS
jgi:diguanylate cyclase (GGDEF)-like protein